MTFIYAAFADGEENTKPRACTAENYRWRSEKGRMIHPNRSSTVHLDEEKSQTLFVDETKPGKRV